MIFESMSDPWAVVRGGAAAGGVRRASTGDGYVLQVANVICRAGEGGACAQGAVVGANLGGIDVVFIGCTVIFFVFAPGDHHT